MTENTDGNPRANVVREILRGNPALDEQQAEDLIDALLDTAAHELANEQRAMAEAHGVSLERDGRTAPGDLINHIDPQVPFAEGGPNREFVDGP